MDDTVTHVTPGMRPSRLLLLPLLTMISCSSPDQPNDEESQTTPSVEFFSWWTSGGEKEALDAMVDVHQERLPETEVVNAAVEFADKAREQLRQRFARGSAPDLFQANAGADLTEWIEVNGHDNSHSILEDLTSLDEQREWRDSIHPIVLDAVSHEGKLFALPVNIHRVNSLFYRVDLFEKFSLPIPESFDDLIGLCQRVRNDDAIREELGTDGSCLALGNKWNWTLSSLTFETIFPAVAGVDFYESYFRGEMKGHGPEIQKALEASFQLYCGGHENNCLTESFFNSDLHELTWDQGIRKLSEGQALMAPMGDWAKGFLESPAGGGLVSGKDFDVVPFPGTQEVFVLTADVIALPVGARNRKEAVQFLRTAGSKAGQIAFNRLKGSLPARHDISAQNFDATQQRVSMSFEQDRKALALSGLISGTARDDLHLHLSKSFRAETTDIAARYLRANYPLH